MRLSQAARIIKSIDHRRIHNRSFIISLNAKPSIRVPKMSKDSFENADWDSMAEIYKSMTEEVAKNPIEGIFSFADALLPWSEATAILDNGCGSGPIMERLLDERPVPQTSRLVCSDLNAGMMKAVQKTKDEKVGKNPHSPWARVEVIPQNATDLKEIDDGSLSHITAGWVYFLTSDPQKCLSESLRVLKPQGVLSLSAWQGNQWMDVCHVVEELYPTKKMPTVPEAWKSPANVKIELEKAGFKDVRSEPVDVQFSFRTMAELVDFFLQKFPFVAGQLKDLSAQEVEILREKMIARGKGFCSTEPGALTGVAIVAAGRKS